MDPVTLAHAVAGTFALGVAVAALAVPKRRGRHTRLGRVYVLVMTPMLITGIVIGAGHPGLSPFEVAVIPTAAPLALGTLAAWRRPRRLLGRHWLTWHIGGMGGSVIGLVTAGLFQTAYRLVPDGAAATTVTFVVPAVVGTMLIGRAVERRVPAVAPSADAPSADAPIAV